LGDDHQAGFGLGAGWPATVETCQATIAFAVRVRKFDRLTAQAVT
jgi:hypothetical protein